MLFKSKVKIIGDYFCSEGDETSFTILRYFKDGMKLVAVTYCNGGMIEDYKWECEKDFSMDENLNDFIDYINEEERRRI